MIVISKLKGIKPHKGIEKNGFDSFLDHMTHIEAFSKFHFFEMIPKFHLFSMNFVF